VRIIDYQPSHLHDLMDGPLNKGAIKNIGYMREWASELQQPGWSYTLIENGHIICCSGIVDMWPGVGEAWFIASSKIHDNVRPFIRFAKTDIMHRVTTDNNLWRVQGVCKADWPAARRFARLMGFEEEGLMRKYGPEQADYIRIAKVT
tara:strand:+ start:5391 stop:5834 length:444 start_codon:yes stop_codon:yes gene_type:complete